MQALSDSRESRNIENKMRNSRCRPYCGNGKYRRRARDPSVRFDHIESVSRYDVVEFFLHERERLIVAHAEQRTVITGIQFGNFQSLVFPDRIRRIIVMLRRRPYGGFHTGSVQIIGDRPDVERIVPIHFFVVPAHAAQIVVDMHHIEAEISRLLRQRDDVFKGNFGKRRPRIRRTKRKISPVSSQLYSY